MTPEEHAEFKRSEAENTALREQVRTLLARVQELEGCDLFVGRHATSLPDKVTPS